MYRQNVEQGLEYLINLQAENGDLRGDTRGEAGMYVHGQATIVLCEAYALTRDEALLDPVKRAISFINKAQHREGGWRYEPKMEGDTSVLGWQVMALQSAKMAGLEVSETRLQKASEYLDSVSSNEGATYGYMPGHPPTPNMTAEALLCRMYLGASPKNAAVRRGLRLLLRDYPPSMTHVDYYYGITRHRRFIMWEASPGSDGMAGCAISSWPNKLLPANMQAAGKSKVTYRMQAVDCM